jgi:hypothetical protein
MVKECLTNRRQVDGVAIKSKRLLEVIYGSIFYPPASSLLDIQTSKTPENLIEIERFSMEQKGALQKEGYFIYDLTGQSIKTLRDSGHRFWSMWHNSLPDFEAISSMRSEVAINPNSLFLPESNNKNLDQQREMVKKYSAELGKKIQGVRTIIGDAPDYAELVFKHLEITKNNLFRKKFASCDYLRARTKTFTDDSLAAIVSCFPTGTNPLGLFGLGPFGLGIGDWYADSGLENIYVIPLVVPDTSRLQKNHQAV